MTFSPFIGIMIWLCGSAGIGRQARLRILWVYARVGSSPISRMMQKWRNWQTRTVQVRVVAIPCGFDSHLLQAENRNFQYGDSCFYVHFSAADRPGTRQSGTAGTSGPSPAQQPAAYSPSCSGTYGHVVLRTINVGSSITRSGFSCGFFSCFNISLAACSLISLTCWLTVVKLMS